MPQADEARRGVQRLEEKVAAQRRLKQSFMPENETRILDDGIGLESTTGALIKLRSRQVAFYTYRGIFARNGGKIR